MNTRNFILTTVAAAAVVPATVHAQTAPAAAPPPAAAAPADSGEIIVTGRPEGSGINKLEAGYSIATLSPADIAIQNPKSTGDLLKSVPGIWVESSGGVATSNIFVRGIPSTGDAPFVTMQFNGVPVYGANSPSFMDQTGLVRLDETIANVEAVNGGPAALFADGQPGLTTNLILREGGPVTHGSLKVSATDFGARRLDGYVSGPLGDDTYYMIGGYVASGDTVRTAGFDTDKGGQITANITHKFDGGKVSVFARYTDDHGEWFLPFAADVPGIDPGTYNQLNNYTRYQTIIVPGSAGSGATERFDLGAGRGWKGVVAGGSLQLDLGGGFAFNDRFGYTHGTLQTTGLVPAGAGAITVAQALAAGNGTTGQTSVQTLNSGKTLAASDYVQQFGGWVVEKALDYISNEASVTYSSGANKLTAGYYFTHFSSDDAWSLGNTRWMQVGGTADLVNLNNGTLGAFAIADFGSADENAFYLSDSYNFTDQLRLDAGVRYQIEKIHFHIEGNGTPNTLNDSRDAVPWSVGLNYRATRHFDVYVRASQGYHFPTFDDLRSQLGNTGPALDDNLKVQSFEGGVKYHDRGIDASLSGFYDKVTGVVYNDVGVPPVVAGSKTYGVEFAGSWTDPSGFAISTDDVLESPKTWAPGDSYDGLQAVRIPKYQMRVTPSFRVGNGDTTGTIYATFEAIGNRYSDLNNIQPLPAYQTLSGGILIEHRGISFQVAADNLTNAHGLTEGNPRFLTGTGAALPDIRPIFGRSFRFTLGYRF